MATPDDIEPDDIKSIPTFRAAYSDRTALLMAKLSLRAYQAFDVDDKSFGDFSRGFEALGMRQCVGLIDRDAGTAGYVVAGDDLIAVVFRGTEDDLDWRTNFRFQFVELQGGARVHAGFFQAYLTIRDTLFTTVKQLAKKKPRPVYLAGHSLGGALAMMATAELSNHDDRELRDCIAACYTFGSPKVGDRSFDQFVKVPLYRVTNGVDIVPAVPPWFGYRQVGDTRYFGLAGIAPLRRAPRLLRQALRSLRALAGLIWSGRLRNVADHNMQVYVGKLAAWAEQNMAETQTRREQTADPEIR
ncbi:MAG: lipase family protein [Xanthobacteraceae bacterium]